MSSARRLSLGGSVVLDNLRRVGFEPEVDVALVETSVPRRAGYPVLLVQNAWNFLPHEVFRSEVSLYPARMRGRIWARRSLARWNVSRAGEVVALSSYMAGLVRDATGRAVRVVPVSQPLDLGSAGTPPEGLEGQRFALVPGTITWYKRTADALDLLRLMGLDLDCVLIAGPDDGSHHVDEVQERAARLGMWADVRLLDREQMLWAFRNAATTIVPSAFESLGFGLLEALTLSEVVVASQIPAHVEAADRVGRRPCWIPEVRSPSPSRRSSAPAGSASSIRPAAAETSSTGWETLADVLTRG